MGSTDSGVEVAVREGEGWVRRLTISVDATRVARARAQEAGALAKRLRLKGFRKGKVPPAILEQRYGGELDGRVQQRLLDEAYRQALDETELKPAGPGTITDIRFEPGQPFVFEAELEVMPTVALSRTGGFNIVRQQAPVTDEEVAAILERIRDEHGEWSEVSRPPVPGDRVSVRITPVEGDAVEGDASGTPYQLVLGAGQALDDVEEAIQTLSAGEEGMFSIDFPDEAGGEGAVISRRLHVALDTVEDKRLPDLTDEFAASVGDFDSVEELEAAVRDDLERHHAAEAEERVRSDLLAALLDANSFVVPQALVDRYLEGMMQAPDDVDPDELEKMRQAIGPHAERQIREQLVLDALIDGEDLAASSDEVEQRIAELAEARGVAPAKLRRDLAREGKIEQLERNLAVEKAFTYLKEQSGIA